MTINCPNCGAMLMNEATVCPVCRQPVPPARREEGWQQANVPSGPSWQQPSGQPSFGPPPLAGGSNQGINAALLVGIVFVLLIMLGGISGAIFYFKSQRSSFSRNNDNYNRYPRATPTPFNSETEPPPPPRAPGSSNTGSPRAPISGGVLNGKATSLPKPAYPAIAKSAKASGTVIVQITIDETGKVISARAVSGHPLLQAAAVQAAYQAQFSPTKLSGQPVKVTGTLSYNFTLEQSPQEFR